MKIFQNTSLRRKQTLIIMLTSSLVLLLACALFVTYDAITFRRELVGRVSVLATAIGINCASALDFDDPKTARETLAALRAEDNIVSACVYSQDGHVFAVYQRDLEAAFVPPAMQAAGQTFTGDQLHLFRTINQGGMKTGTIFVASDLKNLSSRLMRYMDIVGLVLLASFLVALALSNRLQRLVSDPILHLAQVARTVAQDKDYSLRAKKQSGDEIGQLVDGFNEMLVQIQARDAALAYERHLLRTMLDNSPDHIYFKDTQSRFLSASKTKAEQFGLASPNELVGKSDYDFFTDEHARPAFEDEQEIIRTGRPLVGKVEKEVLKNGQVSWALTNKMPLRNKDGQIIGTFGISKDITAIKETEAQLEQAHKQLLETSRHAGMAEIATNVLHNIGNVLNSVNVSASLVVDSVKKSKAASLAKVAAMLREHEHDLGTFITSDDKGKQLPAYLGQLSEQLLTDQKATVQELDLLVKNIEHIKDVVTMQQSYARVSGVKEFINICELVEDGLRMNISALGRHRVEVIREFEDVPLINIDKHRILQILVNLIRNAKQACQESEHADRRLTVRVANGEDRIKISVVDNGIGISPENLTRIFSHGFTTKKNGHGFGLHSGALTAKEMGGALTVHSDGWSKGATFTLELPCNTNGGSHE